MAALEQIKSLIRSFGENDDSRFYATAMQIAAETARKGNRDLADELKKLIQKAKITKGDSSIYKKLPVNVAQKELNDLLELTKPLDKLKDMVLSSDLENSIQRILTEQRETEKLKQYNLKPRKKLLLTGEPGCGKTMTARVIANELALPLFIIRLDGLISRYMGESIAKLRLVFDAMNEFRAVYLFDEFDSIGTTRSQVNEIGEIKRVLNSFLLQIEKDESNSLIIAATNMPESLDSALFRRFDEIINYSLPEERQIFTYYKRELNRISTFEENELEIISKQSVGLNYSDLKRVCEDFFKNILLNEGDKSDVKFILDAVKTRKTSF